MLKYAYKDKEKIEMVEIKDATKGHYYYCPICDAILIAKALNSETISPHFAALPSAPHKECIYERAEKGDRFENITTKEIEKIIEKSLIVVHKPNKKKEGSDADIIIGDKPERKNDILDLYYYFKTLSTEHRIGDRDVGYYLADTRSNYIYRRKTFDGYKIIECKFIRKDLENKVLIFQYPVYEMKNTFTFKVKVPYAGNETNFNYIVNGKLLEEGKNYVLSVKTNKYKDELILVSRKQIVRLPDVRV